MSRFLTKVSAFFIILKPASEVSYDNLRKKVAKNWKEKVVQTIKNQ